MILIEQDAHIPQRQPERGRECLAVDLTELSETEQFSRTGSHQGVHINESLSASSKSLLPCLARSNIE